MKVIESGQLVIELNGIIGECALLAMQVVRDTKAGTAAKPEQQQKRTLAWKSIVQRVNRLNREIRAAEPSNAEAKN